MLLCVYCSAGLYVDDDIALVLGTVASLSLPLPTPLETAEEHYDNNIQQSIIVAFARMCTFIFLFDSRATEEELS